VFHNIGFQDCQGNIRVD